MAKVALIVGVSEYQPGFDQLPSAVKDAEAMQSVLQPSDLGGFDHVKLLPNPSRQQLEIAIYELFHNRQPDDLILFYFAGHGVLDRSYNFYLATPETQKNEQKLLIPPTAVAANYLQQQMNSSRSEREVIILDCCFSGAFVKGMKIMGEVDLVKELGGKGRAILTSSGSTQYSFSPEDWELSIYTHFLVQGIETGAADLDRDGNISVDELHLYASDQVQKASPAMTPQFYPVEGGYRIYLARSPQDDPKLIYRQEIQRLIEEEEEEINFLTGEFEPLTRFFLDELAQKRGLSLEEAKQIESQVIEPYKLRQEKLLKYEQAFSVAIKKRGSTGLIMLKC